MGPLRRLIESQRPRLSRLMAVAGLGVVALILLPHIPRTVNVEFDLGRAHKDVVELRVAYLQGGEAMHGVSFSFPEGAPDRVRHTVKLPPGDFEVLAELRPVHGQSRTSVGKLHAPSDGLVHIHMESGTP